MSSKIEGLKDIFSGKYDYPQLEELIDKCQILIKDNVLYIYRPIPVKEFVYLKKILNTKFDNILIGNSAIDYLRGEEEC